MLEITVGTPRNKCDNVTTLYGLHDTSSELLSQGNVLEYRNRHLQHKQEHLRHLPVNA